MKAIMRAMATAMAMVLAATGGTAHAQNGSLKGEVIDHKSGERLSGASVFVMGTTLGGTTDLDGRYEVTGIAPGTYKVRVSFPGYVTRVLNDVVVKSDDPATLNVKLRADNSERAFKIEDVIVSAERVLSTDAAVLAERMRAATIGDAISSEQISRSPDATSGDALKRVTGLSVVDDKFVFIRGVTDRYNSTSLNGVSLTSTNTDVDRKSFSFDLIPASLLANSVVVKTATPDLPGDFSGGLVQVNTLEFPSQRLIRLTASSSYNTNSTNKVLVEGASGGDDWKARDDGTRALPADLTGNELAQALPNNWATHDDKAPWNGSYGLSIGDEIRMGSHEIGFVGSGIYKNGYKLRDFHESPMRDGSPIFTYDGTRYEYDVLLGGLLNVNYRPHPHHKFSFKNTYNRTAEEQVSVSEGESESGGPTRRQTIEWDQRSIYVGQAGGDHTFGFLGDLEVEWKYFGSTSDAAEPDRKHVEYRQTRDPSVYAMRENYRTWSELSEDTHGFSADATYPLPEFVGTDDGKLKAGYHHEKRERDFGIDAFAADASKIRSPNYGIPLLPIDEIFAPENFGDKKLVLIPITVFTGEYSGTYDLDAYYAMTDLPFSVYGRALRLTGGARVEDADQRVYTVESLDKPEPRLSQIDKKDVLPSANLTYFAMDRLNLRLAFSQSVNRPEFREMSSVLYYDFNTSQNVQGNPNLRRAFIRNYDARVEFFPNSGEVVAFSYFYKDFTDAIEERLIPSPERFVRTWFNSPNGKNLGWEVEVRKSLDFIGGYMENFSVTGNYTKVKSEIEYNEFKTDETGLAHKEVLTRTMQGQSPWMVNLSLVWVEPRVGMSASVLFNKIGRRLDAVGDTRELDVYEDPRNVVDLAFTQKITGLSQLKFTVQDLLGDDEEFTSGSDKTTYSRITRGTTYSISLSLNL